MYGKIFSSIYDGTLVEDWRALITFQQFIVLSGADGIVDMTPHAIARRTGIPIEHIKAGIEILEKEDKYSRTPEQKGRRIELIDSHRPWGWHIVNHEMYKKMATREEKKAADRIRIAKSREDKKTNGIKDVASCSEVSQIVESVADVAHTDTDTDTKIKTLEQSFKIFWSAYPKKRNIEQAKKAWIKLKPDEDLLKTIISAVEKAKQTEDWRKEKGQYVPYPSSWINAKGWLDEYDVSVAFIKSKPTGKLARAAQAMEEYHAEKNTSGTTLQDAGETTGLLPRSGRVAPGD